MKIVDSSTSVWETARGQHASLGNIAREECRQGHACYITDQRNARVQQVTVKKNRNAQKDRVAGHIGDKSMSEPKKAPAVRRTRAATASKSSNTSRSIRRIDASQTIQMQCSLRPNKL